MSENNNDIKEYDENGNITHVKGTNGYQQWYEYDENNNKIYYKNIRKPNKYKSEQWYDMMKIKI